MTSRLRLWVKLCSWLVLATAIGCTTGQSRQAQAPPPAGGPGTYQAPPPAAASAPPPTASAAQAPPPTAAVAPAATQPGGPDPIDQVDVSWLRQKALYLMGELIAALSPEARARVEGIPLIFDPEPGNLNAYAGCTDSKAIMVVTDEMLKVAAYLARAEATDEYLGTRTVDAYIQFVARNQQPEQPLVIPQGLFPNAGAQDGPRRVRQVQVFEEELGFILAHELGHHHLGHLPCTARPDALGAGDIARALSFRVPLFNQPNELAADVAGVNTILTAGARRPPGTYKLTEAGGLLTMRFFSGLDSFSALDIVFAFERSHPPPSVRTPVIQQAANAWRLTGGAGIPLPRLGN